MSQRLLLEAVREVARVTGDVALRHFHSALQVELKADGSEVTIADRAAESAARDWIARHFPGDAVLGEESGASSGSSGRRWLIDPIDGTRSYVRGVPMWGSMIAIAEGDEVLAGAINCSATGELVAAARGEGCWHNESRCTVSAISTLGESAILVTDARFTGFPERAARWHALEPDVRVSRTWGDCYGYLLLVTGRAELMADNRLSPWDALPLTPIVEEAGGVITDWSGRPGARDDAVATNAALAAVLRERLGVPVEGIAP